MAIPGDFITAAICKHRAQFFLVDTNQHIDNHEMAKTFSTIISRYEKFARVYFIYRRCTSFRAILNLCSYGNTCGQNNSQVIDSANSGLDMSSRP
jgi:hypothetical protein